MTSVDAQSSLAGARCVVLGGGGFIGTHLCRMLVARGASVHGYGRRPHFPDALQGMRWTDGEFADRASLEGVVAGSDFVFHLLGGSVPDSSNSDPVADLLGSTAATIQLLDICRASRIRKLVYVSSGGTVYGIPKRLPIAEDAPTDPISAYGISKLASEKYLHLYQHLHGLDYSIMRVANPFGPFQTPFKRQGLIAALMRNVVDGKTIEIWGDGGVVRDYIYIEDVAEALMRAMDYRGAERIFNVGSGVGRSVLQVLDDIAHVMGAGTVDRIHKSARATDVPVNVLDIHLARRELGWEPSTPWLEALETTARWVKLQQ